MAISLVRIIKAKLVEDVVTSQYVSTSTTIIDKFTVSNTSSSDVEFSCYLVGSGEIPLSSNLILPPRVIAPNEVYPCPELILQLMTAGEFIATYANVAESLVISASGRLVTA